jgi:ubiquitin carboxyl-terminal hydrolase 8
MSSDAAALPNSSSAPSWAQHVVPSTGMQPGDQRASRVGRYQNGNKPYAPWTQRSCFPHIKDLQDEAALLDVNENSSV